MCRAHDRTLKNQVVRSRPKAPSPAPAPPVPIEVHCGACQRVLDEPTSLPDAERQPCPQCGSLARLHKVTFVDTLTLHESLRVRSKQTGKGGWMADTRTGDDYTRDLDAWGTRTLEKDRVRNVYREAIRLYDGTSLESIARLTDHHD